jgi:small multidrug resistance pump
MNTSDPNTQLARYRGWFYAAALYNLLWGSVNVLFPNLFFDIVGMAHPNYAPLWQVVGMLILVYAPAYWWAARYPFHHRHLILIALIGKLLGPLGFVWSVWSGSLPLVFGWTILTNDLIWWPAFFLYLRDVVRLNGGLWSYLSGR